MTNVFGFSTLKRRRALAAAGTLLASSMGIIGGGAALSMAVPATTAWAAAPDCTGTLGTAGQYSEWSAGSATRGPGIVGGPAAYGGSATFGSSGKRNGPTIASSEPANASALNLVVGGALAVDGPTTLASGSGQVAGAEGLHSTLTVVGGGTVVDNVGLAALPFSFATVDANLKTASNGWANASGPIAPTISGHQLNLTGTNSTQDVFDITEAQLAAAANIVIDVPSASPEPTVLINVSGAGGYTNPQNQSITYTNDAAAQPASTLWNFDGATSVALSGVNWAGTIVAPFATSFSATNGSVEGSIVSGGTLTTATTTSWNTGVVNGQLDLFTGKCLPSNTGSAPLLGQGRPAALGAIALLVLGGGTFLVLRRRRGMSL